jgi:hypothetical protein
VPGRGRLVLEQDVLNRRKQREQSVSSHCPSLRFLCCLLFKVSCVSCRFSSEKAFDIHGGLCEHLKQQWRRPALELCSLADSAKPD